MTAPRDVAALPETHPLTTRRQVPLSGLAREPFVLFPRRLGPGLYDQTVALCRQAGFSPNVAQHATPMQTITGLVSAGIGVSLVPASVRNLRGAGVVYRELREPSPMVELAVACRRDDESSVLRAFLNVVRETASGSRRVQ